MALLESEDPEAVSLTEAIKDGDVERLERLLADRPGLATSAVVGARGEARSPLHLLTDWPGHVPDSGPIVKLLVAAGADVDAPFVGRHEERPLHWAASNDDVESVDALLDAGADVDAPGSVVDGGTPLADAVTFGQWQAARRLVERGATTTLWQAAALGHLDRLAGAWGRDDDAGPPGRPEIDLAFWSACHGGQLAAARYLHDRGADLNRAGPDGLTALDAAIRSGAEEVVAWLRSRGAKGD